MKIENEEFDIQNIPDEVKILIFSKLSEKTLATASLVSKEWHALSNDAQIWRQKILEQFPYLFEEKTEEIKSDPKSVYRSEYENFVKLAAYHNNKYSMQLLLAIARGDLESIESRCELSKEDKNILKYLSIACHYDEFEDLFLAQKHKVLAIAAFMGHFKMVGDLSKKIISKDESELVESMNSLYAVSTNTTSTMIFAASINEAFRNNQVKIADFLIAQEMAISTNPDKALNEFKHGLFLISATFGYFYTIKHLLSTLSTLKISEKTSALLNAGTNLYWAENREVVKLLVANLIEESKMDDAIKNEVNEALKTTFIQAARRDLPLLQYLFETCKDIVTNDFQKTLMETAELYNPEVFNWLKSQIEDESNETKEEEDIYKNCLVM